MDLTAGGSMPLVPLYITLQITDDDLVRVIRDNN